MRKQVALSVVMGVVAFSVPFGILPDQPAQAADCLAGPNSPAPQGSHWYYRIDRVTKRRCWYIGAQGIRTRAEAPQTVSSESSAAPRRSEPPAATPVRSQPTVYEIIRRLNTEDGGDSTVGQSAPEPTATTQTIRPVPIDTPERAPILARDDSADLAPSSEPAPAAGYSPSAEPVPRAETAPVAAETSSPLLFVQQAPAADEAPRAEGLKPAYLLALLFGFIALVCFFGPVAIERLAKLRFDRPRRVIKRPRAAPPTVHAPAKARPLAREIESPRRADVRDRRPPVSDPSREYEDALQWLARAAGAARREHRAQTTLAASAPQ